MIYAIGDIHGELPLLEELIDEIRWDAHQRSERDHKIIFIGDYVDRGLHSRGVVDLVMKGIDGFETICLRGNHEQMLIDFVETPTLEKAKSLDRDFVGGRETLESYDIGLADVIERLGNEGDAAELLTSIPGAHMRWMANLPHWHFEEGFCFVHAGVRPGVSLEAQQERDALWIRGDFTDSDHDHGAIIVHGHTTSKEPEVRPNRINVDTGACLFGTLTAVALEKWAPRFLQVTGERTAPFPSKELMAQRQREREEAERRGEED